MMQFAVIAVVTAALIIGALWGIYWKLPEKLEGFMVAMAGGSLMVSALLELIHPAMQEIAIGQVLLSVGAGAITFTLLDYIIKEKFNADDGSGLLIAITLDGIPENLALGVSLISANPLSVAALSCSIFLSNLPEAAGSAKEMSKNDNSNQKILILWIVTTIILSGAALVGYYLLSDISTENLHLIKCFAAGAVVATLAIEVFPQAYAKNKYLAGLATAIGFLIALYLMTLGE